MITGYIVEKCDDGADKWLRCNARLCPELSYRVNTFTSPLSHCQPDHSIFDHDKYFFFLRYLA